MNRRGLFFTLGVTILGWVFFSFSVSHDALSKDSYAQDRVVELERAGTLASNVASNVAGTFARSSGMKVVQRGEHASFEGRIPWGMDDYVSQVTGLKRASAGLLNVSLQLGPSPYVVSGIGANFTQASERSVFLSLPEDTGSVVVSGVLGGGIGNCTLLCEPGDARLMVNLTGSAGSCTRSCSINVSAASSGVEVNDGEAMARIASGGLTLTNDGDHPLAYSLSVSVNRTGFFPGPVLAGRVVAEVGQARKAIDGVML